MKEIKGDLWMLGGRFHDRIFCITTNGTIKKNGKGVMGRGCAEEAMRMYPGIDLELGKAIKSQGNIVNCLAPDILSFPVKHNWWEKADKALITRSATQLNVYAKNNSDYVFLLPRPGCGNGGLVWAEVRPLLHFLCDNVLVVSRPAEL